MKEYQYIVNPATNRKCRVDTSLGKRIITNYVKQTGGVAKAGTTPITDLKDFAKGAVDMAKEAGKVFKRVERPGQAGDMKCQAKVIEKPVFGIDAVTGERKLLRAGIRDIRGRVQCAMIKGCIWNKEQKLCRSRAFLKEQSEAKKPVKGGARNSRKRNSRKYKY